MRLSSITYHFHYHIFYSRILLVFLVIFSLGSLRTQAQSSNTKSTKISPELLIRDLTILKDNLIQAHPELDKYYPLDSLLTQFASIKNEINRPMSGITFYRKLLPLHKYIANGHTELFPPQSFLQEIGVQSNTPRIPFDFYYDKGKLYVLRNMSGRSKHQTR